MMLYLALPLTILLYWLTRKLYQRIPLPFINPLLIPMVALMLLLHFAHIPLQQYMDGTWIINWLLKPAVVALALPLYQQMLHIKAKIKPIMLCCTISVVISILIAVVIMVGISGAVIGFPLLKLFGVTDPQAQGLAMGACSHAIGTAAATERGTTQGAFSSLALVVCGILTSLIAPVMFAIYGFILGIN